MRAADALDRVLRGEPVDASKPVQELAELASLLQSAWQDGPTPAAADRGRAAAMEAFVATPAPAVAPIHVRPSRPRRVFARVALVAALVAGLPTAAWAASEDALPGQMLYPLKRGFEETWLILAGDAADEAGILLDMAEERLEEALLGLSLSLGDVVDQALFGYDDAMARFETRINQAQAEGLPVEALLEQADGIDEAHDQLFDPPLEPTPAPSESSIDPADKGNDGKPGKGGKHKGKGGANKGGNRGNRGGQGSGSGSSVGSAGGAGGSSGEAGNAGGGGGKQGGGGQEAPPSPPPAEAEDDDHEHEGEGQGLGHEKAKGNGHHKDKGEGHDGG